MTLEQRIQEDMKSAMMAREAVRLGALRAVKAAIMVEKTAGTAHDVTDSDVVRIMQKQVKQRRESAEQFSAAGRPELAEAELAEAAYIEKYLPRALTPEELEVRVREIVTITGASSPADMGKVMGVASKQLAGVAEGRAISETVKKILNGQ